RGGAWRRGGAFPASGCQRSLGALRISSPPGMVTCTLTDFGRVEREVSELTSVCTAKEKEYGVVARLGGSPRISDLSGGQPARGGGGFHAWLGGRDSGGACRRARRGRHQVGEGGPQRL